MDFINDLAGILGIIGSSIVNFVDFIVNLPLLLKNMISVLPNPLFNIVTVFISFIIIIILAKVVKTFVS